jgi:ketose-bisphosphate aldolase
MASTPMREIVADAFNHRYGVPAINVVNDLTMQAVLKAAVLKRSPLIVQTSVKTVRTIGVSVVKAMWDAMTEDIDVPVALHLDHCPDRAVLSQCLAAGWDSVLFDASHLPVAENLAQTIEVVAEARSYDADVEGEIESITGQEDGIGSDEEAQLQDLDVVLDFLDRTGVNVFAPAIGNAHGTYKHAPVLNFDRVSAIVAARPVPIALHGGSGMSDSQFRDLIARGCAKVNISTALKERYMQASLQFLKAADQRQVWDPPSLFSAVEDAVVEMTSELMDTFGSTGRAA